MPFRYTTRRDVSRPIGWAAPATALAAILTFLYAREVDHLGRVFPDPPSWLIANVLAVASLVLAVLAILTAVLRTPTGRGWRPAAATLTVIALLGWFPVVLLLSGSFGN